MPAHTPGPWTYKATAGNHDFAIYPETTGRDVALVRDFNEANARLIAVAPEQHAMLKMLESYLQNPEPSNAERLARLANVRAILATAEGSAE